MKTRIAIFASGFGSNARAIMQACHDKKINAEIVLVVSDKKNANVHQFAKEYFVQSVSFERADFQSKEAHEIAIINRLKHDQVDFIVLAGYMRLIGKSLLDEYEGKIINIHPSLLPKYRGLDAIGQAIQNGEKEIGVTVHYVDAGMDTGKIIAQKKIEQNIQGKEKAEIEKLVHEVEHELYVEVLMDLFNKV